MYFKRKYADTFNAKGKITKAPKTRELHSLSVMINKPKNKHINAVIYFIDQNLRTL
jgi:hypothetical protein